MIHRATDSSRETMRGDLSGLQTKKTHECDGKKKKRKQRMWLLYLSQQGERGADVKNHNKYT